MLPTASHKYLSMKIWQIPSVFDPIGSVRSHPQMHRKKGKHTNCAPTSCHHVKWTIYELVGGWTNPSEKYPRQIGNLPQIGVKIEKTLKPPPRESMNISHSIFLGGTTILQRCFFITEITFDYLWSTIKASPWAVEDTSCFIPPFFPKFPKKRQRQSQAKPAPVHVSPVPPNNVHPINWPFWPETTRWGMDMSEKLPMLGMVISPLIGNPYNGLTPIVWK